jgi:hypothetical protein
VTLPESGKSPVTCAKTRISWKSGADYCANFQPFTAYRLRFKEASNFDNPFPEEERRMIHNNNYSFSPRLTRISLFFTLFALFGVCLGTNANAQAKAAPKARSALSEPATTQQPPFSAYKGVRIGMSIEEARGKLGQPTREFENQDLYVVSDTETSQLFYDATHRVEAISIDYLGDRTGAPDYKAIVGGNIQINPDGSMHKMVRFEQLGFWVSFSRTAGDLGIITVTIKKIR